MQFGDGLNVQGMNIYICDVILYFTVKSSGYAANNFQYWQSAEKPVPKNTKCPPPQ